MSRVLPKPSAGASKPVVQRTQSRKLKQGNDEPFSATSAADYLYNADETSGLLSSKKPTLLKTQSILGSENIGDYASKKMMGLIVFTAVMSSLTMGLLISGAQTAMEIIHLAFETCGTDANGNVIVQCDDDGELLGKKKLLTILGAALMLTIGMVVVCTLSPWWSDLRGRRQAIMEFAFLGILAYAFTAASVNWPMFLVGRFLCGFATTGAAGIVPTYIAEVIPPVVRGQYGAWFQLMTVIGQVIAPLLGMAMTTQLNFAKAVPNVTVISPNSFPGGEDQWNFQVKIWWRVMLAFPIIPLILQIFLCLVVLPGIESPKWLITKGKLKEAAGVYKQLYPKLDAGDINEIIERTQERTGEHKGVCWALSSKKYRRGVLLGCGLSIMQQLTGINLIMTNVNDIFSRISGGKAVYYTTGMMVWMLLATLPMVFLIDRLGRKTLLLVSGIVMSVAMTTNFAIELYTTSHKEEQTLTPEQKNDLFYGKGDLASHWDDILVMMMVFLYVAGFAFGYGGVIWVYLGDIYPTVIAASCSMAAILCNNLVQIPILFVLGMLSDKATVLYGMFSVFCILALLFVVFFVVETKGTDVEHSPVYAGVESDDENDDNKLVSAASQNYLRRSTDSEVRRRGVQAGSSRDRMGMGEI
ncbi:unnamed protein product [Amoebophrya sp. A120]|nr:unnamed protein product [Amoebophrya sp. A120]|eukprot:GSA120T00007586001.1